MKNSPAVVFVNSTTNGITITPSSPFFMKTAEAEDFIRTLENAVNRCTVTRFEFSEVELEPPVFKSTELASVNVSVSNADTPQQEVH